MSKSRLDRVLLDGIREKLKPVLFLTSGTRGDVQPITALAGGLQSAGYAVRVAAPPGYRELVESQSLPFAPLEGNPSDLLAKPGAQSTLTFNDHPLRGLKSLLDFLRAAQPVYARMIRNGWEVSRDASALVIGLPTIWGTSIAQALGIPCIGAFLQPMTETSEFPSPLLPSRLKLGSAYNRLTYRLITQSIHLPWRTVVDKWRGKSLGLTPLPLFHNYLDKIDRIIYGFSEMVVPKPKDWNYKNTITGYWWTSMKKFTPTDELQDFIRSGASPYFFGFGSPGMYDPAALTTLLINLIEKTAIRAILSLPEGSEMSLKNLISSNIFLLREDMPHEWLFPQMMGIIHHGGAGTTSSALRAGVPSFVAPLAADQFFWGERVHRLGVGPQAIPQRQLTLGAMEQVLLELKNERIRETARRLGEAVRAEDGVARAVRVMDAVLGSEAGKETGKRRGAGD